MVSVTAMFPLLIPVANSCLILAMLLAALSEDGFVVGTFGLLAGSSSCFRNFTASTSGLYFGAASGGKKPIWVSSAMLSATPQCSIILPSFHKADSMIRRSILRPVGGTPRYGPVFVPVVSIWANVCVPSFDATRFVATACMSGNAVRRAAVRPLTPPRLGG